MNYHQRIERFRARLLERALRITKGDTAAASALLGLNRAYFYVALKRYGVELEQFRPGNKPKTDFGVKIEP